MRRRERGTKVILSWRRVDVDERCCCQDWQRAVTRRRSFPAHDDLSREILDLGLHH